MNLYTKMSEQHEIKLPYQELIHPILCAYSGYIVEWIGWVGTMITTLHFELYKQLNKELSS